MSGPSREPKCRSDEMQSTTIEEIMDFNPRTLGLKNANVQQNEFESTSSSDQNVVRNSAPQPHLQDMPLNGPLNVSDQPQTTSNQDQYIVLYDRPFWIVDTDLNETPGNFGPSEPNPVSEYPSGLKQNIIQNSALPLSEPLNVSNQPQSTSNQDQYIVLYDRPFWIVDTDLNETPGNFGPSDPNPVSEYPSGLKQNIIQNSALPLSELLNMSDQPQITDNQDQDKFIYIFVTPTYHQPSEPNHANHQQNVSESANNLNQNMVLNSAPQPQLQDVPLNAIEYKSDQQQSTNDQVLLHNLVQCEGDENSQQTTWILQQNVGQQFASQPKAQQPLMHAMQPNGERFSIDETVYSVSGQSHVPTVSANASACNLEDSFLWVQLAVPGEGLKQFLHKNWKEMLKRLPIPRPMNHGRLYEWQKEEPEDPEKLEKWLSAIKQKYWRIMKKRVKIPTNEEEGKKWQQKFEDECKTDQRNY